MGWHEGSLPTDQTEVGCTCVLVMRISSIMSSYYWILHCDRDQVFCLPTFGVRQDFDLDVHWNLD
jgi:hypothetical protein